MNMYKDFMYLYGKKDIPLNNYNLSSHRSDRKNGIVFIIYFDDNATNFNCCVVTF